MKAVTRIRRLTPTEAAKYRGVQGHVARELPHWVRRRHERMEPRNQLRTLCDQLRAAREEKGLSLADLTELTGMDRSAVSKLETGKACNPTIETLIRYAEAAGKRLTVRLAMAAGK